MSKELIDNFNKKQLQFFKEQFGVEIHDVQQELRKLKIFRELVRKKFVV